MRYLLSFVTAMCVTILGSTPVALAQGPNDVAALRKALDADPKNARLLLKLLGSLKPNESRADLGDRFAKLDALEKWFPVFVDECRKTKDAEALEILSRTMKARDPSQPRVDQYILRAKLWAGKSADATAFFKNVLKDAKPPHGKSELRDEYLRGMARNGKALEAYRAFPGGNDSFRVLAEQLVASGQDQGLRDLIAEHGRYYDDDSFMGIYRGQMLFAERKYAEADAAWTAAFRAVNDEALLDAFRNRWAWARHASGKIVEAFNDIPPAGSTFQTLAELCLDNRQHEQLEKLLEAHAKTETRLYSAMDYRVRMYAGADAATLQKIAEEKMPTQVLQFMARAGKPIEAYKAATDGQQAFKTLSSTLRIYGTAASLRELIEIHRKLEPNDPELDLVEGELFLELKQPDKAMPLLKKYMTGGTLLTRYRGKHLYERACSESGKALEHYRESGFDESVFAQLASHATLYRDAATLKALLEARPADGLLNKRIWEYEMSIKIWTGKTDEAIALFLANNKGGDTPKKKSTVKKSDPLKKSKKKTDVDRPDFETSERKYRESRFVREMMEVGQGMAAYRVAAFPEYVFPALATHYLRHGNIERLESLLDEHRKKFPQDAEAARFAALVELKRGDVLLAEKLFRAELARPDPPPEPSSFKTISPRKRNLTEGLSRSLIRQGRTLENYRLAGNDPPTFGRLARLCVEEKAVDELESLIVVHRKDYPTDPNLVTMEGHVSFMRGKYEAAFTIFKEQASRQYADEARDRVMSCLIRLKKVGEAVKLAKEWRDTMSRLSPTPLVLALAAAGDVKEVLRLMEQYGRYHFHLESYYLHEDLGPLLRAEAMRQVRERFPEPVND